MRPLTWFLFVCRPDFDAVLAAMAATHSKPDIVGVFYCGPKVLRDQLTKLSHKHSLGSATIAPRFDMHAEQF